MVSHRCKMAVKAELEKLGLGYKYIELGEVFLDLPLDEDSKAKLKAALLQYKLLLMDDKIAILIEKIINTVVETVHYPDDDLQLVTFSTFLSEKLEMEYHKLSSIFSKTKGITIEHFIILHKIERVKELIIYDEMNLNEIAFKLRYSSAAHLSRQFKQITGLTPSFFKTLSIRNRTNLEDL